MRENGISTKVFESSFEISLFRSSSICAHLPFASVCNLLGLKVQDLGEDKSQTVHGRTVREITNMISLMVDVIGIHDGMHIGKGNAYTYEMIDAVTQDHKDDIPEQKPTPVNL